MNNLESLKIESFRGIKGLKVEHISNLNIFFGENNAGKTSILEAIQLISNPMSKSLYRRLSRQRDRYQLNVRNQNRDEGLSWLFTKGENEFLPIKLEYKFNSVQESVQCDLEENEFYILSTSIDEDDTSDEDIEIQLEQKIKVKKYDKEMNEIITEEHVFNSYKHSYEYVSDIKKGNLFECNYISSIDHKITPISVRLLNHLILDGKKEELITTLKYFDSNIEGLELLASKNNRTGPYIQHKELGIVPINVYGDGLRKALLVASKIIDTADGILLIDEIETGIHTSLIPNFIKWVRELCDRYNVKLFATTHSLETIDGILKANLTNLHKTSFYRLIQKGNQTKVKYFSGDRMKELRYEFGQDVR